MKEYIIWEMTGDDIIDLRWFDEYIMSVILNDDGMCSI
jgi:hypothetical protein